MRGRMATHGPAQTRPTTRRIDGAELPARPAPIGSAFALMADGRDRRHRRGGRRTPKRLTARAFRYAEGDGPAPAELEGAQLVDRFGAAAVFGKDLLSVRDMRRMSTVENIVNAYRARAQSENWAEWAQANPALSRLLNAAIRAAHGDED